MQVALYACASRNIFGQVPKLSLGFVRNISRHDQVQVRPSMNPAFDKGAERYGLIPFFMERLLYTDKGAR